MGKEKEREIKLPGSCDLAVGEAGRSKRVALPLRPPLYINLFLFDPHSSSRVEIVIYVLVLSKVICRIRKSDAEILTDSYRPINDIRNSKVTRPSAYKIRINKTTKDYCIMH